MKRIIIISVAIILSTFLFGSCQKAKETEGKKEAQTQQEEVKQETSQTKLETKEKKLLAIEPSPLTKEEQKFLWKKDTGPWNTPSAFTTSQEAIKYLKILLKGNHANIIPFDPKSEKYSEFGDSVQRDVHAKLICTAIQALGFKTKSEEAIDTAIKVFQKKSDYPEVYACAARYIGQYLSGKGENEKIKKVIPLLKEAMKHSDPNVRLQAAGSLLSLGEADTALPVLDELAEKEGSSSALYYLFTGPGKIIDERGYSIVEKALNNSKAEVRIKAVKLLLDAKKITKDKAEEIALKTLEELKDKKLKNYGLMLKPNKIYEITPLPNATIDVYKAEQQKNSDARACEDTIHMLGDLKSKKAISALGHIEKNNTEVGYVCKDNNARDALHAIERDKK